VNGPEGIQTIPEGGKEQDNEPIQIPMIMMNRKIFLVRRGFLQDSIMTGLFGMIAIPIDQINAGGLYG
jgi:hypothetical protein